MGLPYMPITLGWCQGGQCRHIWHTWSLWVLEGAHNGESHQARGRRTSSKLQPCFWCLSMGSWNPLAGVGWFSLNHPKPWWMNAPPFVMRRELEFYSSSSSSSQARILKNEYLYIHTTYTMCTVYHTQYTCLKPTYLALLEARNSTHIIYPQSDASVYPKPIRGPCAGCAE